MRKVDNACEEAQKKVLSTCTLQVWHQLLRKWACKDLCRWRERLASEVAEQNPLPPRTVGGSRKVRVAPEGHQVCHVGAKCCGHLVGRQRPGVQAELSVPHADLPNLVPHYQPDRNAIDGDCGGIRSHNVDPSRYVVGTHC